MKRIWLVALAGLMVMLLAACGGEEKSSTLTITLPADTPQQTVELVRNTVPAMKKYLPGLLKYQSSVEFLEVLPECYYSCAPDIGLPADTTVTWLAFKVADNDSNIPHDYYAKGHRISIGIEDSGKALILQKKAAQAVFLDSPRPSSGDDRVIWLHE